MSQPVSEDYQGSEEIRPTSAEVLFLCTGNYYRSRLAEELFNHLARTKGISRRATSLGFTPHPEINPGTISPFTLKALALREIVPLAPNRFPSAVQPQDFSTFQQIIAMSETEHRPMMQRMFPNFISKVHFWQVEDLAWEKPESAIAKIEKEVRVLLSEIDSESRAMGRSGT